MSHNQETSLEQLFMNDDSLTEKQKKILAAAIESFSEKGYAATSTNAIAKKAGVAEGTIFRHYKTKKELLLSITAPMMAKMIAPFVIMDINKVLEHDYDHLEDFLRAMVKNRMEFIKKNAAMVKILLQEIPFHPDLREQFIENIGKKVFGRFVELVKYYQDKGDIIDMEPSSVVRLIAASLIGYVGAHQLMSGSPGWNSEKELENSIHYIMHGLKKG
ncbi:TetR/AcrR family transcriptional regulator [Bacillus benzoevorans]|uniref:AcrR family transcriptional regulator n=1 Tax=Bacillus benzoevorans TaxID=1456 RepID=A0A7X0HRE9_9BACI|nr:TetR/AcrR family transcriptional regulator [Bacillus benzoevorans]MBB6445504.1 AcrR family transcriptional regulator [Bacillus benzoevorans]